mmetsp:Transcript_102336/g.305587  ORF Transcript_102336/g.305587 Transcript_102336/m.305587 type:complete len:202 (-) Transcript_102336:375-980(-)
MQQHPRPSPPRSPLGSPTPGTPRPPPETLHGRPSPLLGTRCTASPDLRPASPRAGRSAPERRCSRCAHPASPAARPRRRPTRGPPRLRRTSCCRSCSRSCSSRPQAVMAALLQGQAQLGAAAFRPQIQTLLSLPVRDSRRATANCPPPSAPNSRALHVPVPKRRRPASSRPPPPASAAAPPRSAAATSSQPPGDSPPWTGG